MLLYLENLQVEFSVTSQIVPCSCLLFAIVYKDVFLHATTLLPLYLSQLSSVL